MLNALILMLMSGALVEAPGNVIRCEFPSTAEIGKPISVSVSPRPSLRDRPGLFRATMQLNGTDALPASIHPIRATDARDVMIRTKAGTSIVSIGLRDDGRAALKMALGGEEKTRVGECHGDLKYINRWLAS